MATDHSDKAAEEKAARRKAHDAFNVSRSEALNAYAVLERYMGLLFSHLLGADDQKAFIVFASLINNRSRLQVLESLVTHTYGDEYKKFFPKLTKQLQSIDSFRNKLVHWIIVGSTTGGKPFEAERDIFLAEHPNIYRRNKVFRDQILDFREKAKFYGLLVYYFQMYLRFGAVIGVDDGTTKTWHEIFQQPPTYPPEDGHPLTHSHREPLTQHPPSQA